MFAVTPGDPKRVTRILAAARNDMQRTIDDFVSGEKLPTIGTVWKYALRTYDETRRDLIYAYRGANSFGRINRLYSVTATAEGSCRFVLLTDVHHASLENYLSVAEQFAQRYGLLILSLTWFGEASLDNAVIDDGVLLSSSSPSVSMASREVTRRQFERDLAEFCRVVDDATTGDENDDDDDDDHGGGGRDGVDQEDDRPNRRTTLDSPDTRFNDLSSSGFSETSGKQRIVGDYNSYDSDNYHDDDDDDDDDAVAENLDSVVIVRGTLARDRFGTTHSSMRNHVLAQFFAELILYIRPIPICDHTGVIAHKAFRLIHRDTIDRYHAILASESA